MRIFIFFLLLNFLLLNVSIAQTSQVSIGSPTTNQFFTDIKFDPSDGSIVNVGFTNNAITGNDLLIIKLNSSHNIVWSKTIANNGDDNFTKIIVCSNGDYLAVGQFFQAGVKRGIACRFNSTNGDIIWTSVSANTSAVGEVFWDVIETVNNNIALAGYESFTSPLTNSFVVLLNSSGTPLWSFVSTKVNSDGFQAISQLPNNNLIVGGIYIESSGSYNAAILELNESNGSVVAQNTYGIGVAVPQNPFFVNTISPVKFFIRNNIVICQMSVYQGYGSASFNSFFTYDQITRNLSGNILFHSGTDNANAYCFYPITESDYLVGASYTTPISAYIARITNGLVAFNRQINSTISYISGLDVSGTNASFSGAAAISGLDGYNLFSSIDLPTSTTPCDIANSNTFFLQSQNITAFSQNALILVANGSMNSITPTIQNASLTLNDVCGFVLPVQLLDFNAVYNSANNDVSLKWRTSSELNSKEFIVERSGKEGNQYTRIGIVNAAGTSNSIKQYYFTDEKPLNGINLYRLKQVDIDGRFKYADVQVVDCSRRKENDYTISPVPAKTFTRINFNGKEKRIIQVDIFDITGKLMQQQTAVVDNNNSMKLDLQGFAGGMYFLKISSKNNSTVIKKIIIE